MLALKSLTMKLIQGLARIISWIWNIDKKKIIMDPIQNLILYKKKQYWILFSYCHHFERFYHSNAYSHILYTLEASPWSSVELALIIASFIAVILWWIKSFWLSVVCNLYLKTWAYRYP